MIRLASCILYFLSMTGFVSAQSPSFENAGIIIECPNSISYYYIEINNDGKGRLAFCYNKNNHTKDVLTEISVFNISREDMKDIDKTLSSRAPDTSRSTSTAHDTFKYILAIDKKRRIDTYTPQESITTILRILLPYLPEKEKDYDYCGFFGVFKKIINPAR